jgi:hypothetical protein
MGINIYSPATIIISWFYGVVSGMFFFSLSMNILKGEIAFGICSLLFSMFFAYLMFHDIKENRQEIEKCQKKK